MTTGIDPAIQAAQPDAAAAKPDATTALDPLQKERDALLLSEAGNPQHALYHQAVKELEQLGAQRFKDRRELERVALAIAMQASAIGLTRIDRVAACDSPSGYFFVDEKAVDPALRGYVSHAQAVQPGAEARLLEAQRVQEQQRAGHDQQRQAEQVQRDVQARERQEQARRDPPTRLL